MTYRNNSNSTRPLIIAAPLYGAISLCLIASNSCRTRNYTAVTAISIAITLSGVVRLKSHIMITTNEVKIN